MVKMTSVVGYIAVQDLTKVSDIIRSHTMDAFFPLIATAVIYFAIANLMTGVLGYAERCINPKRRKREVKGVETDIMAGQVDLLHKTRQEAYERGMELLRMRPEKWNTLDILRRTE